MGMKTLIGSNGSNIAFRSTLIHAVKCAWSRIYDANEHHSTSGRKRDFCILHTRYSGDVFISAPAVFIKIDTNCSTFKAGR